MTLRANASLDIIERALVNLTPMMSKRLGRLLDIKEKKRAERNRAFFRVAKANKEEIVSAYNLVVEMRSVRIEKMRNVVGTLLAFALNIRKVTSVQGAIDMVDKALKED